MSKPLNKSEKRAIVSAIELLFIKNENVRAKDVTKVCEKLSEEMERISHFIDNKQLVNVN